MVVQRTLNPFIMVRIHVPQLFVAPLLRAFGRKAKYNRKMKTLREAKCVQILCRIIPTSLNAPMGAFMLDAPMT